MSKTLEAQLAAKPFTAKDFRRHQRNLARLHQENAELRAKAQAVVDAYGEYELKHFDDGEPYWSPVARSIETDIIAPLAEALATHKPASED